MVSDVSNYVCLGNVNLILKYCNQYNIQME